MRKLLSIVLALLMLTGCAAQQTLETVTDDCEVGMETVEYSLSVTLPEGAAEPVMESGNGGKLFSCDGFWVTTGTFHGGDIGRTLLEVTGFEKDALNFVETKSGSFKKYHCAWTSAGEGKEQICRTVILDDGRNHHAVTVICDFDLAGVLSEEMNSVLDTAALICID